jgi:hypothetical protein
MNAAKKNKESAVQVAEKPGVGILGQLFGVQSKGHSAKELVPVASPQNQNQNQKQPQALKEPAQPLPKIRTQETVVGPREPAKPEGRPEVTSPSKIRDKKNRQKAKTRRREHEKNDEALPLLLIIVPVVLALGLFSWRGSFNIKSVDESGGSSVDDSAGVAGADQSRLAPAALANRVEVYRQTMGQHLNRERVHVEYENALTAPNVPLNAQKVSEPDPMLGLPLHPEGHHRGSSRDQHEVANGNYAEVRVQDILREQIQNTEQEREARQRYIDEFVANAARAGYRVKIDKNGNVTVNGQPPPENIDFNRALPRSGPSGSGSVR